MSQLNEIMKARTFNVFLMILMVIALVLLGGMVALIIYVLLDDTLAIYNVLAYLAMIFISIPLTMLQYFYIKDRLIKKMLVGLICMFGILALGFLISSIADSTGLAWALPASRVLFVLAYAPVIAIMAYISRLPESRKFNRAIGRFIALFHLVAMATVILAAAWSVYQGRMMTVSEVAITIVTVLDIVILMQTMLLLLAYMPTKYRYVFACIFVGEILCFATDATLFLTSLSAGNFDRYYPLYYAARIFVGTIILIGLSLLNITPITVEEVDKKLSDTRLQMEDLVMQSPDATGVFSPDGTLIMANCQLSRLFQVEADDRTGWNLFDHLGRIKPEMMQQINKVKDGSVLTLEDVPVGFEPDEEKQYFSARIFPTFTSEGKISGFVAISQDTTARKRAEEALRKSNEELEQRVKERTSLLEKANGALQREIEARLADELQIKESLHEKEVLLKEIHHRVKNNLQIVSSMLSLQSSTARDPAIMAMNKDSQNRIRSMALIHEKLYQTKNLSSIDFGEYVKSLVGFINGSYNPGNVRVSTEIREVMLDIDRAIPCGLIINELYSNCLKHAFRGRAGGEIYIGMRADESSYSLIVRDDGIGIDPGIDTATSATLGLSLVYALASQLEANVKVSSGNGTEFSLSFPRAQPKKKATAAELKF